MTTLLRLACALPLAFAPCGAQTFHVLSNFDAGSPEAGLGTRWDYSSSGDEDKESRITSATVPGPAPAFDAASLGPGQGGTAHSAKLGFSLGTRKIPCGTNCFYDPEVRLNKQLIAKGKTSLDLTGASKLTFWTKADKPFKVMLRLLTTNVTDDGYFQFLLDVGPEWKEYSLELKATVFKQPSWADPKKPFDLKTVNGLSFVVSKENNATLAAGEFLLDEIRIHDWQPPAGEEFPSAVRQMPARANEGTAWPLAGRRFNLLGRVLR